MMDGAVKFLSENINYNDNPAVNSPFEYLLNKDDGETVAVP